MSISSYLQVIYDIQYSLVKVVISSQTIVDIHILLYFKNNNNILLKFSQIFILSF